MRRSHLFFCFPKAKHEELSSLKDVGQSGCTNPHSIPVAPNRHYYFFSSSRPFNLEGWGGKKNEFLLPKGAEMTAMPPRPAGKAPNAHGVPRKTRAAPLPGTFGHKPLGILVFMSPRVVAQLLGPAPAFQQARRGEKEGEAPRPHPCQGWPQTLPKTLPGGGSASPAPPVPLPASPPPLKPLSGPVLQNNLAAGSFCKPPAPKEK